MIGRILALSMMFVPAPAIAGIGGEIAYSLRGGREIYLVNPDGSGKRLVYRAPAKKTVLGIDMRHNGSELTFEEVDSSGQTGRLKTITYGASGLATVTRSISGGRFQIDTAPDGTLLFVDIFDGDIKRLAPGSSTPVSVGVPRSVSKVAWLADGSFLYASQAQVWRATLASPSGTALVSQNCVQSLKGAHTANEALLVDACAQYMGRLSVSPVSLDATLGRGQDPSYSPDDHCFIYITPSQRGGSLLKIQRLDGSGTAVQVEGKGNYASVDWRGDSSPAACPVTASSAFDFRTP